MQIVANFGILLAAFECKVCGGATMFVVIKVSLKLARRKCNYIER